VCVGLWWCVSEIRINRGAQLLFIATRRVVMNCVLVRREHVLVRAFRGSCLSITCAGLRLFPDPLTWRRLALRCVLVCLGGGLVGIDQVAVDVSARTLSIARRRWCGVNLQTARAIAVPALRADNMVFWIKRSPWAINTTVMVTTRNAGRVLATIVLFRTSSATVWGSGIMLKKRGIIGGPAFSVAATRTMGARPFSSCAKCSNHLDS
jgi:hypothetical protein